MTQFNPLSTAVVVVDMQNDFCHPDGALYAPPSEAAIEPVAELVEQADEAGANIVYTRDVHPEGQFEDNHYYDEFDRWGEHVVEGTWGAEIVDGLDPDAYADYIVDKQTYDAFHNTYLTEYLSIHGITDLLICGTLANVCVLHTAGSAGLNDFKPVVVTDALGFLDEEDREYAVNHAEWLFGETAELEEIAFQTE